MTENMPRILSIDDEPNFTETIKQYFEPRGYHVDITTDGSRGLSMLGSERYDVVLLDLRMAGISGDQVMSVINEKHKNVKVIFITAYSDSGQTRKRLMGEGAYAFVDKPITSLKDLEGLINDAVNDG